MTGAITNINDLEKWFKGIGWPYFTVLYQGPGNKAIYRNLDAISDVNEAWEELRHQVEAQGRVGRAMLEVLVYKNASSANNPIRTNLDIRPDFFYAQGMGPSMAGVNSLPAGYIAESELQRRLADEREKWELQRRLDDLEAQVSAPTNMVERGIQMLGEYPALAGLVNNLLVGFLGKNNPAMAGAMQPVNGMPGAADDDDEHADPRQTFERNIHAASNRLGVDPVTLSVRLNQLVQKHPELAIQLLTDDGNTQAAQ